MITIKEAISKGDLTKFVKFPFVLYKDSPYFVPPIIKEELQVMDPKTNPVFKNAAAKFFLAYKNGEIVGRIAGIVNHIEVDELNKSKVRFGWFDFIDDIEVSKALLNKVVAIGLQHNLSYIEGPVGFSNMDKAGLLIEGFNELNTMITW